MLLDEPTNHLDIATTEWLEGFLIRSRQAVIVVSHDRYFLDRVTQRTVEIYRGGVNEYTGNFSAYWRQRKERHELQQRTYEKQQEFIARTEDFIRRNAYGQKHAQAKDREKKLERLERVAPPPGIDEPPITFPKPTRTGDWVLRCEGLSKSFSGNGDENGPLFDDLHLQVDRGDRLAIFGPNGSGKTTLVRILTGELSPDTGQVRQGTGVRIAYFDQQLTSIDPELSAVDAVRPVHDPSVTPGELRKLLARFGVRGDLALQTVGAMSGYFDQQLTSIDPELSAVDAVRPVHDPSVTPGELRKLLARFGVRGDLALQTVGAMSGGEKTRVALAKLASAEPNVLILDEPTNHLDFWSAAALEQALGDYPGTAIVVSHDRFFLDRVATKMLVLEHGGWRLFEGNYSDYLHLSKVPGEP
ncbi:MAG: ABC transporter ATP-binding protein, partial [Planctomycetota bacterium]